jgi:hypothetical protein
MSETDRLRRDVILLEARAGSAVSPVHSVLVRPYAYGQYRIQLTRTDRPDYDAPEGHGSIVRELCTYNRATAYLIASAIATAEEPEAYCFGLERPWNCEYTGGRIRLDNTPADRPETVAPDDQPSFTCPRCRMTSYHPEDIAHRYCGHCHEFHR